MFACLCISCSNDKNVLGVDSYLLKPRVEVYPNSNIGILSVGNGEIKDNYLGQREIIFALPVASAVVIWIVPISSSSDESAGYVNSGGITLLEIESAKPVFLVQDNFEAGVHNINWNYTDLDGNRVPGGWYRIYLSTPEFFDYRDKYLWFSEYDQ